MSIAPISTSAANPYQAQVVGAFKQRGQDFKALGKALQSGDLVGAQQAFAALKKGTQTIQSVQQRQSLPSGQNRRVSPNFKTVESALNSGDLSGAQKGFAIVQQDIEAVHKSPGGHVHQPAVPQGLPQNDNQGPDGGNSLIHTIGTNTNQTA